MLSCSYVMKCDISLKLYFLDFHVDTFPRNLEAVNFSDKHQDRCPQDIFMEERFAGKWNRGMLVLNIIRVKKVIQAK